MKQIIFPGHHRQPSEVFYSVFMDSTSFGYNAHIVVVQSSKNGAQYGTFLSNSDEGRDNVLNRIIQQELKGIRLDYIRFSVIFEHSDSINGTTWPIMLSLDSYIANGNPHESKGKEITFLGYDVVGGCANVYTVFEEGTPLDSDEITRLLKEINYYKGN